MNHQDIADRARRIAAQSFPGVPFQVIVPGCITTPWKMAGLRIPMKVIRIPN